MADLVADIMEGEEPVSATQMVRRRALIGRLLDNLGTLTELIDKHGPLLYAGGVGVEFVECVKGIVALGLDMLEQMTDEQMARMEARSRIYQAVAGLTVIGEQHA